MQLIDTPESNYFTKERVCRPSYPVGSVYHQTFISKSLFEHTTRMETIAAVALVSRSFQNSSLAPNLAGLTALNNQQMSLFYSVFNPKNTLTIQFTPRLTITSFTSAQLRFLASLKQTKYFGKSLRKLTLSSVGSQILADTILQNLPALEDLEITTSIPPGNIDTILSDSSTFPSFKTLSFGITPGRAENKHLKSLCCGLAPFLTSLDATTGLARNLSEEDGIEHLARAKKLRTLELCGLVRISNESWLRHISGLGENLTSLNLSNNYRTVTDANLSHISSLVNLRTLQLVYTKVADLSFTQHFKHMSNLTELDISNGHATEITDEGLKALARNQGHCLRVLKMDACGNPNFTFDLSGANDDNDEELRFSKLEHLSLDHTDVTEGGIKWLSKHANSELKHLVLNSWQSIFLTRGVSDAIEKYFGSFLKMEHLSLLNTEVKGETVVKLLVVDRNMPKLKYLGLDGCCEVDKDAVLKLRRELPMLEVHKDFSY